MPNTPIRTVIIPAAGKPTRLLPATKVAAKKLLPVYDGVVLDVAMEQAIGMGAERIVPVISTEKVARQACLGGHVTDPKGKPASDVARTGKSEMTSVLQDQPHGLGHAVLCCSGVTLPGPFAVLLLDDIILAPNCLAALTSHNTGGHRVAAMRARPDEVPRYGIFRLGGLPVDNCIPVAGMVEKPTPGKAPSSIATVGRYVLGPGIDDALKRTPHGKGRELQLSDAIALSAVGMPVVAFKFSGTRHDCGAHDGLSGASDAQKAISQQEFASAPVKASHSDTAGGGVRAMLLNVTGPGPAAGAALAAALVDTQ